MTMNVSLTPELEEYVNEKVRSGLYSSASEVVREGLRRLRQEDELRALQLEELRSEIRKGSKEFAAGKGVPIAEAERQLKAHRAKRRNGKR